MAKHFLPELPREPAPLSAARPRRVFSRPAAPFPAAPLLRRTACYWSSRSKKSNRGIGDYRRCRRSW